MANKKLWFRAKHWGYGWTPISWQGWIVTIIYVIGIVNIAMDSAPEHSGSDFLLAFAPQFILLTLIFLALCYLKGEKPAWHWNGKPRVRK